jgi:cytochrome c biogenesis protein CcmG/thiol:disulfide interchange protein DsbE
MRVDKSALLAIAAALVTAPACGGTTSETPAPHVSKRASPAATSPGGIVGKPAPEFSVGAIANGKGTLALSDLRGKVVLVDFWGTFCGPCKKSFPKLQSLYSRYGASGLKIVGISEDEGDDKAGIPDFARTYGAKFLLGWDEDKSIARSYKPPTMPSSFLIDRDGVIRYAHVGYHDGEELEVEHEIRELLR